MQLVYLPPYSPDFNPIEEGFSAMKAWIQQHCDDVLRAMDNDSEITDPFAILFEAVFASMTPDNISGWYRDSGYVS